MRGGNDGKIVTPGKSAESEFVISVAPIDPKKAMPPQKRPGRGGAAIARALPAELQARPPMRRPEPVPTLPPPAKPLTAEQVGLVRAWIDQGAK